MIYPLLLLLFWQEPSEPDALIWDEVLSLESVLKKKVQDNKSQFIVPSHSPVRGYYVERIGVIITVPVRFRSQVLTHIDSRDQKKGIGSRKQADQLAMAEVNKRLSEWKKEVLRKRKLKEINFETVVKNIRSSIPQILRTLTHLPPGEAVVVVIEERVPSWYYAGFSMETTPKTKIVTLTIDNRELISGIRSKKTLLPIGWEKKIKRKNSSRSLIARIP